MESMKGLMSGVKVDGTTGSNIWPEDDQLNENQKRIKRQMMAESVVFRIS